MIAIGQRYRNPAGRYLVVDLTPTRVQLRDWNGTTYWVTRVAFANWLLLDGGRLES